MAHAVASTWPSRALRRERLIGCLLVVTAAHAGLMLSSLRKSAPSQAAVHRGAVQVRLVPMPGEPAPSLVSAQRHAADARHREPSRTVGRAPVTVATPRIVSAEVTDADATYLPRTALSVTPKALTPVAVAYPSFDGEVDHYDGEFELFIDETGVVARVIPQTPDLPPILGHAVREAFLAARFAPGQVDGHTVRSRIRIGVTFDSQGPPAP
jgi:hypothetical protein